ncbi:MAG: hypothetical protein IJ789_03715 [Bacteroidales bacterium]|nr:hypothetical protein [Bacteroidales bacterium]
MNTTGDINENEIRVVGTESNGGDKKPFPKWIWAVVCAIALLVAFHLLYHEPRNAEPAATAAKTETETETRSIWFNNVDASMPAATVVRDTVIDSLHLRILTPYNATPELHVGKLDTNDRDIVLATMAADLRRDNGKIVGAFVLAGEPLSWGLSKKGYCAIIDGQLTLGTAENSPLFEQATERGGYFFRQYAAVDGGKMVPNNPENASTRRALCLLDGKVSLVVCLDRVLMNDFSTSLVKLGADNAILLVGGMADGWYRDTDSHATQLGSKWTKNHKYINYMVFRKQ